MDRQTDGWTDIRMNKVIAIGPLHTWSGGSLKIWGWSGGAKVLDKLPVPGRPKILITVG